MQSMVQPQPQSGMAGADPDPNAEKQEVLDAFNARLKHSKSHWQDWRQEYRDLCDVAAGRQWDPEDEAKMREELRPMVTLNVSGKYLDAVTGLQINNRQDIRYYPRQQGAAKVNEIMTGAVAWGRDLCDQLDEETDAFYDCILGGLGWMEGYLDKDLDPNGVPAGTRIDPLEMFPDPAARKKNLTDARYQIRIKPVDEDEYEEMFGEEYGATDEDLRGELDDDDGVEIIPSPHDYDNTPGSSASMKRNKCYVADYQWWKRETRYLLQHPELGEKELSQAQYDAYQPFFAKAQKQGQRFKIQPFKKKVYYRAFISKGRFAKDGYGLSPYQEGFTFHAITGKRDRNKNIWYGIGRSILDPQKWLNKFFSTILYAMMSNAKGGLMAEENAFKDARKAESEWANPSAITWMKAGAISGEKVMPKPQAQYPQGLDRLMEFSMNALPQTSGLNVELMGLAEKVQAGVVEAQRKQSAMAIIAWAFDAMRRYYRSMGRQQARYVIDYVPEGTLVMISGESGKQYVPLIKHQVSMKFDVIVDEAPTSVNMQERTWAILESFIPQMLQAGMQIPKEIFDYAPIPVDLAEAWKKALTPNPQKAQLDQQMAMNQVRKVGSEAAKNETAAQVNQAAVAEKQANAQKLTAQALEAAAQAGHLQAGGGGGD